MRVGDHGGPAFPGKSASVRYALEGMTLRDYFAAQVLNGLLASWPVGAAIKDTGTIAHAAYELADAMLAARTT